MSNKDIFHSSYVIDGVTMDSCPAQLLGSEQKADTSLCIVDESLDASPGGYPFESSMIQTYLNAIRGKNCVLDLSYGASYARCELAYSLIEALWTKGHFLLEDLALGLDWSWKVDELGSGAALYQAALEVAELASDLDLSIEERKFSEGGGERRLAFNMIGAGSERAVKAKVEPQEGSWIIYLPFDTDDFHLGGSLLTSILGIKGGKSPRMEDSDYLIDCVELVRELVEDGILLSAATVRRGGLLSTLDSMTSEAIGMDIDISGLLRAYPSSDPCRILFSELPGAVIQISDSDFDYIDAEMILQDLMYFPLGHPSVAHKGVRLAWGQKTGIEAILDSLVR